MSLNGIVLSFENYVGTFEIIVKSSDENRGSVDGGGVFNLGDIVSLSCDFTGYNDSEFLGWREKDINGEIISTQMDYTFKLTQNSPIEYYAVFSSLNPNLNYQMGTMDSVYDVYEVFSNNADGLANELVIPSKIYKDGKELQIKAIKNKGFANCVNLTNVVISEGIEFLGSGAFSRCTNLENVSIPNSLKSLGYWRAGSLISVGSDPFVNCTSLQRNNVENGLYLGNKNNKYVILTAIVDKNFSTFKIQEGCKIIYPQLFSSMSAEEIIIPDGVVYVGEASFYYLSLNKPLILPSTLRIFGERAFEGTTIGNITTDEYGVVYAGSEENPYLYLIYNTGSYSNLKVQEGCVFINGSAFENSLIQEITLPDSLLFIGYEAFQNSSLISINIPASVQAIAWHAFYGCSSLQNVTFDDYSKWGESRFLIFGQDCNEIDEQELRADPLSFLLDTADVRYYKLNGYYRI